MTSINSTFQRDMNSNINISPFSSLSDSNLLNKMLAHQHSPPALGFPQPHSPPALGSPQPLSTLYKDQPITQSQNNSPRPQSASKKLEIALPEMQQRARNDERARNALAKAYERRAYPGYSHSGEPYSGHTMITQPILDFYKDCISRKFDLYPDPSTRVRAEYNGTYAHLQQNLAYHAELIRMINANPTISNDQLAQLAETLLDGSFKSPTASSNPKFNENGPFDHRLIALAKDLEKYSLSERASKLDGGQILQILLVDAGRLGEPQSRHQAPVVPGNIPMA